MLIAEELLLLLLDDRTGKLLVDSGMAGDPVLAGSVLIELAIAGRVDVTNASDGVKEGRLILRDRTPLGDPLLDEALRRVGELAGKKPAAAITALAKKLRPALLERLAAAGVITSERGKVLGIFPTTRWPEADPAVEASSRGRLGAVLHGQQNPDIRDAAIISMLLTAGALKKVFPVADRDERKALSEQAKAVADSEWASAAAKAAVQSIQSAVVIAATIPAMVAATS